METQRILSMTWFIHTLMTIMIGFFLLLESQALPADGNGKIVFMKILGDKFQVVVTDEDGGNMRNLSGNDEDDHYPSWSPDGRHIAFSSNRDGDGFRIYIMDSDGSNKYQVTENKVWERNKVTERSPSFSSDGKKLVFTRKIDEIEPNARIYTIDIDGRNERYLADGWSPEWSPDGKRIVFHINGENVNGNIVNGNITIMDIDGRNQVKIADSAYFPSWSPDGKQVAFTSGRDKDIPGNQVYRMDSDGSNIMRLTEGMSNAVYPSWSPDGQHIVFCDMATFTIYKVRSDGGTPILIADDGLHPSWFDPDFYAVNPIDKYTATWGGLKRK